MLIVNSRERELQGLHAEDGDWRAALELLAAVEPNGRTRQAVSSASVSTFIRRARFPPMILRTRSSG